MSLEYLISKYIDGELSQTEDNTLRQMLKDNPYSKEKFDMSVELHLDLIDDRESITVPSALYKRTEEAVLMKILANAPAVVSLPKPNKQRFTYQILSFAAMISFFALVTLFNTSDSNHPRIIEFLGNNSKINIDNQRIEGKTKNSSNFSKSNKSIQSMNNLLDNNNEIIAVQSVNSVNNPVEILNNKNEIIAHSNNSSNIETDKLESKEIVPGANSIINQKINSNLMINPLMDKYQERNIPQNTLSGNPISGMIPLSGKITSVQLTTLMSQDFVRTGISTSGNSPVISMSQSLGYNIDDHTSFGLEFGIIELQYDYVKYIPVGSSPSGNGNGIGVNTPFDGSNGSKIYVPVSLEHQQQIIWGLAFYDTKIISYGNFSLSGRLGLGATDDGPLGLSRVFARYRVFDGLSLTAGAEGKIFMMKTPLLETSKSTISSYGFVYGVQFNF
jgi:hypothetical protein